MSPALSRLASIAILLIGIAVALWLAFGPPQDWEGGMRWLRHGLVWGSLGLALLSARLIFPATRKVT
ncbi:hypothetical protein ACH4U7_28700 [Streptomyces sp. NPDC020845]|uniref:hypothetical protein n=1 Tax=Streptomyces sp. NPDC020845 TaxID=3365096 RepID=UPI00378EFCDA